MPTKKPRKTQVSKTSPVGTVPDWMQSAMQAMKDRERDLESRLIAMKNAFCEASQKLKDEKELSAGYARQIDLVDQILNLDRIPPQISDEFDSRLVFMRALRLRRELVGFYRENAMANAIDRLNDSVSKLATLQEPHAKQEGNDDAAA